VQKTEVAIITDHSASMRHLTRKAMEDYNSSIESIRKSSSDQDVRVSHVMCGVDDGKVSARAIVNVDYRDAPLSLVPNIAKYDADGRSTPLFDSIGDAIACLNRDKPDVAFLVMVITDGQENSSQGWNARSIAAEIKRLQNTDKWTFVFRVPRGERRVLEDMGIPPGNIVEWEQSERGYEEVTRRTTGALDTYFIGRSRGVTSSGAFFANVDDVSKRDMRAKLVEADDLSEFVVPLDSDGVRIDEFCRGRNGPGQYVPGRALYQLTKTESDVQDYKLICIRDRANGKKYAGAAARKLLGLPERGTIKLAPGKMGNYELFVQSTSVNRKLKGGTRLLYKE